MSEKVAVLGASPKPDRYSFKAIQMLLEHGHHVFPIGPREDSILEQQVYRSYTDLPDSVDTLTLYVNPQRLEPLVDDILASPPRRVIFNPGTESAAAAQRFSEAGIETQEACTLVLLSTGQYLPR